MNIDLNKVAKFFLICFLILGSIAALGGVYTAYVVDQQAKIKHYNYIVEMCNKIPGAIINVKAYAPVFGSGIEINCNWVNKDPRKL